MEILLELNKFSHIKYYDEPHKYYADKREFTSATTFIGNFKNNLYDGSGQLVTGKDIYVG